MAFEQWPTGVQKRCTVAAVEPWMTSAVDPAAARSDHGAEDVGNQVGPAANEDGRGIGCVRAAFLIGCQRCWLAMPM